MRLLVSIARRLLALVATGLLLGLSLLPLSCLLLAYPAINPQESVLAETVSESRGVLRRTLRRLFALASAVIVLIVLLAGSVELATRLPLPEKGQFSVLATAFLSGFDAALGKTPVGALKSQPLASLLPPVMVQHWPVVVLFMYAGDLIVLGFLGKIPLSYNVRNIVVRWKVTSLTVVAFVLVVALIVSMLGFVKGMNDLTENTGIPGNVFVLAEGATDETFSSLGYGDVDNVERAVAELDPQDRTLKKPVRVKTMTRDGKPIAMASKETYYVLNQPIPGTTPPKRRFVQVRSVEDRDIAVAVHNADLKPGGQWFTRVGVDDRSRIQCVLGEGVAATLGADQGKPELEPGDTFSLGDMEWVVTGVMRSEGTTFGSEIWVQRFGRIYEPFGKRAYTTLVMRVEDETADSARALAYHLSRRYTQQKLKAFSEPDYYAELTKTNNMFLVCIAVLAGIMAVGGVFGMMTTMFASIAQRKRDIGVLRLLGFKRWQILVSFMLESLTVAVVGGAVGVFVGWARCDGQSATSTLSGGGGGGGKNFAVTIDIDVQIVCAGMLLTLVMGRLGGLVPALSAMRMKILDSLR
jgi:ABC-type lipoprotein release transport system permease subunit